MAEDAPLAVNLRILSPSAEVEGGVQLADLPASTTVRELRQRIHDAAPSRPATDRMRLIYRGRVVANDADTLLTVFGADNIHTSKDQSLHLVLRELPAAASAPSPAPQPASAPPNPLQPPPPQSPLQTNPFRNLPEPRPHSQPQPQPQPHHHHHAHHHHHHPPPLGPLGPRAVPLPTQLQFAQHARNPQSLPPHIQQQFAQLRNTPTPPQAGTPTSEGGAQPQPGQPQPPMGLPNLPAGNHTRTVRQEGIGPNGERWTVTWNNTTNVAFNPNQQQHILPRPFPHPGPGFGLPPQRTPSPSLGNVSDQMLHRIRRTMEYARQEMENVRVLIQPPGGQAASVGALAAANPPAWRVDQIRISVRNLITGLDNVDRGLASLVADPLMAQNRDFVSLQQSASDLRRQAEEFNRLLDQLPRSDTTGSTPASSDINAQPPPIQAPDVTQSQTSNVPTELFILSSPQGPVGILFDQRGTYSTAPPTMSFQSFSQQFNANRYQLGNLGRQIAVHNHLPRLPAHVLPPAGTPTEQPAQHANQAPVQVQNQNANPAQPAAAAPAPGVQVNRVDNIAGHLWLIFKLAVFVYFFAGGGGWYRPLMICLIAGVVYIAQVGIFEEHFATVRGYLETLLPPGALGFPERVAAQQGQDRRNGNAPGQQNLRTQPNRYPTPEQAARRLQHQHQDQRFAWVRETARTTERGFAMFVASLWPGIGERMVQAQEERVRAEREAEEARVAEEAARREEEQKKEQEAEESKQEEATSSGKRGLDEAEAMAEGTDSKGKGKKARVDEADGDVD